MAPGSFDVRVYELRVERSRSDLFGMAELLYGAHRDYPAFVADFFDELSGRIVQTDSGHVALPPYARVWLR